MENLDNTGLGLIKTTIERVQNGNSLFGSALKKLANSTEEELDNFLKMKIENKVKPNILRLISGGRDLSVKALSGKRLIYQAAKTFKSYIGSDFVAWGLNKNGVPTQETALRIDEIIGNGTFMDIFRSLPGNWEQKFLSQDQIIEFCEKLSDWLRRDGYATMFLAKIDENKPVNEERPQDNLVVVSVSVYADGLYVYVHRLGSARVWFGSYLLRVVSPQLIPLAE